MQSHPGLPSSIPSQPHPRRDHESKSASCLSHNAWTQSVCQFAFDLHKCVIKIHRYLPYTAPSCLSLSLSPSLPLSLSLSLTHTHIHIARLFLLEMPGGLGSTIWSPPSAKDTFAGSQCSFLPTGHYPVHGVGELRAGLSRPYSSRGPGEGTLQHGCRNGQTG